MGRGGRIRQRRLLLCSAVQVAVIKVAGQAKAAQDAKGDCRELLDRRVYASHRATEAPKSASERRERRRAAAAAAAVEAAAVEAAAASAE